MDLVKKLSDTIKSDNLVSKPISVGIDPVKKLKDILKRDNPVSKPISVGIDPLNLRPDKSKSVKLVHDEIISVEIDVPPTDACQSRHVGLSLLGVAGIEVCVVIIVGEAVLNAIGAAVAATVDAAVGLAVGAVVLNVLGAAVANVIGGTVGVPVGTFVPNAIGATVAVAAGVPVGVNVGAGVLMAIIGATVKVAVGVTVADTLDGDGTGIAFELKRTTPTDTPMAIAIANPNAIATRIAPAKTPERRPLESPNIFFSRQGVTASAPPMAPSPRSRLAVGDVVSFGFIVRLLDLIQCRDTSPFVAFHHSHNALLILYALRFFRFRVVELLIMLTGKPSGWRILIASLLRRCFIPDCTYLKIFFHGINERFARNIWSKDFCKNK